MTLKSNFLHSCLILLCIFSYSPRLNAQQPVYAGVTGFELDSRYAFSLTTGLSLVREHCATGPLCFRNHYAQVLGKYNFTKSTTGLQVTAGYSDIFGARIGMEMEYSTVQKKAEIMVFIAGGLDLGGSVSLVAGPKINLSRNLSEELIMVQVIVQLPFFLKHRNGESGR